jgi:RHS repeat-associated protein
VWIDNTLGASGANSLNIALYPDHDGRVNYESYTGLFSDGSEEFIYNNDSELTRVQPGSGSDIAPESYSYDPAGNRTSATTGAATDGSSSTITTGGDNELTSDSAYSYTYDADGNLISRTNNANGDVDEYTWDNRDRLVSDVTTNSSDAVIQTATYTYSPITNQRLSETVTVYNGAIVSTTTENYVYDPNGNLLIVLTGSGSVKERDLTGLNLSQIFATETGMTSSGAGTVEWALTDQVGSVTDVLDNSGNVLDHIRYDSFGNVEYQTASAYAMRFGFAGMQLDSAKGLYYDNARYYNPQNGTFVSQDPLSFGGGDYNVYRYVAGNPLNDLDPTGLGGSGKAIIQVRGLHRPPQPVPDPGYLNLIPVLGPLWQAEYDLDHGIRSGTPYGLAGGIAGFLFNMGVAALDLTLVEALGRGLFRGGIAWAWGDLRLGTMFRNVHPLLLIRGILVHGMADIEIGKVIWTTRGAWAARGTTTRLLPWAIPILLLDAKAALRVGMVVPDCIVGAGMALKRGRALEALYGELRLILALKALWNSHPKQKVPPHPTTQPIAPQPFPENTTDPQVNRANHMLNQMGAYKYDENGKPIH